MIRRHWLRTLAAGATLGAWALIAAPAWAADDETDPVFTRGTLSVAVYRDFFPYSGVATEGGIDNEVAAALAQRLGVRLSLLPFDAGEGLGDDLRNMVWKGHYLGYGPADVMLHVPVDPALSRANDKVAIFAPYHAEMIQLAIDTKRIPDWQGFDVFDHEKIAVDGGSYSAQIVLGLENGRYRDHIVNCRNIREAIEAVRQGRAAAVMAARSELQAGGMAKEPFALIDPNALGIPRHSWITGMAVKVERQQLRERLEKALHELQDSGELAAIYARHQVRYVQP